MGLDMYAHAYPKKKTGKVIIQDDEHPPEKLAYWRKHNALHNWMENHWNEMTFETYQTLCGFSNNDLNQSTFDEWKNGSFNCINLPLDEAALDKLADDIQNNRLVPTSGFFFGPTEYNPMEMAMDDLEFVIKAKAAIKEGKLVVYSSWW